MEQAKKYPTIDWTKNEYHQLKLVIDAFLSDESRHEVFNENVVNFIKHGWDVFVISNKINHFDSFSGVKYFEYDSTNRVLTNTDRYQLHSFMNWSFTLLAENGDNLALSGFSKTHGFTNWTLFHNLRRIAEVMKRFGHTHFITCEYDNQFKSYNLMDTLFKDFGKTENSTKCMVVPAHGWKCMTSLYLISVDVVLNTLPYMPTEDDYEQFMRSLHNGLPISPVYEELFGNLFVNYKNGIPTRAELIPESLYHEVVDGFGKFYSTGDMGFRHKVWYRSTLLCPVNDNTEFLMWNNGDKPVFVNYRTKNYTEQFLLSAKGWAMRPCDTFVDVVTSDMLSRGETRKYDLLTEQYNFTLQKV